MTFVATDPSSHQSENTWFTPPEFIKALGPFDFDPCTVSYRPFDTALLHVERDKGDDGLLFAWVGDVWLNPPYGKEIGPFIDRFIEHKRGCMLIFARMGSPGVQKLLNNRATLFCLRKRVRFIQKDFQESSNAGTDSCIVFFDDKYIERLKAFEGVLIEARRP